MVKRFRTDSISALTESITTDIFAFLIEFKEESFTLCELCSVTKIFLNFFDCQDR